MGGGLMQLVAYGAQDIYLTGNPQITFFKVVYRRHTNFAMETVGQTFSGTAGPSKTVVATISRNGDLVGRMYVTSTLSTTTNGASLVDSAEVEIGGQKIDKHTAEWMQIWNELSTPDSKAAALKTMQGCVSSGAATNVNAVGTIQVPLQFWFNRNPGLALPLIALQYHEVKVKIVLGAAAAGGHTSCALNADYIYLDTDERRRFAQVSHEYLIEQVQEESAKDGKSHTLNFNHPVKELVWTNTADYTDAKLVLNGHDRFAVQPTEYFQLRQPMDHHTAVPGQNVPQLDVPNMLGTPIELVQSPAVNGDAGAPATGKVLIGAEASNISLITLHEDQAPTGVSLPKVGDIVSISVIDPTDASERAIVGLHTVTNAYNESAETFSVTPGLPVTTDTDFVSISIVARAAGRCRTSQMTKKINCYSFALKPEEHQPSGTCNFSRIDNAQLVTGANLDATDKIYAVNYNVLRVMSGMGGLAYSN